MSLGLNIEWDPVYCVLQVQDAKIVFALVIIQVAQGGSGVSIPGDIQSLAGQSAVVALLDQDVQR